MKRIVMLTPCYNEEARLDAFLDSIRRQTVPVEVIAIDDGSSDKTYEKLKSANLLCVDRNPRNMGITRTMNRLYEAARSFSPDYLSWSGVDEELYPDSIERRVKFLENTSYDMVVTGADAQTPTRRLRYPEVLPQFAHLRKADFSKLHEELLAGNFFQTPILLNMRTVQYEDLLLDLKTRHFCDWDQYLTFSRKYRVGFLDESTGCSDWDGNNFSRPNPSLYPEKLKEFAYVLSKHLTVQRDQSALFVIRIIVTAVFRLVRYYSDLAFQRLAKSVRTQNTAHSCLERA